MVASSTKHLAAATTHDRPVLEVMVVVVFLLLLGKEDRKR